MVLTLSFSLMVLLFLHSALGLAGGRPLGSGLSGAPMSSVGVVGGCTSREGSKGSMRKC